MKTKSTIASCVVILLVASGTHAEHSVVLGRALENRWIRDVEVPCPENHICQDVWVRWVIDAKRTLNGPELRGRVTAAAIQHTEVVRSYQDRIKLFVLTPIDSPEDRRLLRADYYLSDSSKLYEMYCLDKDTDSLQVSEEKKFKSP